MVSEDPGCRIAIKPTVPSTAVHTKRPSGEPLEALNSQVFTCIHPPNDVSEADHLLLLTTPQRIRLEEGNHLVEEVPPSTNDEHQGVVANRASVVLPKRSTVKALSDKIENFLPTSILADTKLRHELEANPCARVSLERNVKAAFSIYKSRNICIQSFLLIDRTCHIVTTSKLHDANVSLGCNSHEAPLMSSAGFNRCFQHIAKFIDSAYVHCLTTF